MARKVATTKESGGGGNFFEEKTAARLMTMMLAGHPPLDEQSGCIRRIDFQNSANGWHLDDLVLTLNGPRGKSHFALSVKSDKQVTGNGFSGDFVSSLWKQWLGIETSVFDRTRDHLGLVVSELPANMGKAWSLLLSQALDTDPQRFLSRLKTPRATSDVQRKLFKSLACNIPDVTATDEETVLLLRRLRLFVLDFENTPSHEEHKLVSLCRDILESQSRTEAHDLWRTLLGIARVLVPTGGTLDLKNLIDRLRGKFRLKEFPDYASDVRHLSQASQRILEELTDRIGGSVALDRRIELDKLSSQLDGHRGLLLLGASGSGKSVLAKQLVAASAANGPIAWFDAQTLDEPSLATIETRLTLRNTVSSTFANVTAKQALLVLDGLDRFTESALRNAAQLIKASQYYDDKSPWKLILTCQPEEWDSSAATLIRHGVPLQKITTETVDFPKLEQLTPVWNAFQNLRPLARRRELSLVLRNVHLLNVVASNAALIELSVSQEWVGESHLIRWFWRDVVEAEGHGHARSQLLQKLGRNEADGATPRLAISQLTPTEASLLGDLEAKRICKVRDGRISFTHDLFGDWARLRILISEVDTLDVFIADRITTPRWFKAVRLLGLDMLEQQKGDITSWRDTTEKLRRATGKYDLQTDLLLDSIVFSANPEPLLEAIYSILTDDKGLILGRLLNRFLYVATVPNPLMTLAFGINSKDSSHAATTDRDPDWPLWPAILRFLASHTRDVAALAPREGALVLNQA